MLLKDEVGMLQRVPLFAAIEPTKLKLLAFTSDRVSYSAGQILFRQGDEETPPMSSFQAGQIFWSIPTADR